MEGKEKTFDLIDITRPDNNYIVLESLNQMKENCKIKSIHIISLTDDPITIGRGHESDVRINDISVSRSHASLKYNGTYWTRSASSSFSYAAVNINSAGFISEYAVDGTSHCIRPSINISL